MSTLQERKERLAEALKKSNELAENIKNMEQKIEEVSKKINHKLDNNNYNN